METNPNNQINAPVAAPGLLSFFDLLKESWKNYQKLFRGLIGLTALSLLAIAPIFLAAGGSFLLVSVISSKAAAYILAGILVVAAAVSAAYYGSAVQAGIICLLNNQTLSIKESFNQGRGLAVKYLVIMLLTGLLVLGWSLLFIIPGIIFSFYYGYGQFVLVAENQTGYAALKRSKELVQGFWWPVAYRSMLLGLVLFAALFVISIPLTVTPDGSAFNSLWNMLVQVIQLVVSPLVVCFSFAVYNNLVRIKDAAKG